MNERTRRTHDDMEWDDELRTGTAPGPTEEGRSSSSRRDDDDDRGDSKRSGNDDPSRKSGPGGGNPMGNRPKKK